jgi:putative transposase
VIYLLYASRKVHLKHLTEEDKELIQKLCQLSKEVYNQALKVIEEHYKKAGKVLHWIDIYKEIKDFEALKDLGTRYQAILKEASSNYWTYVTYRKNGKQYGKHWNIYDHFEELNPPAPKKHFFPLFSEDFQQKDSFIKLPLSVEYRKTHKDIFIELPETIKDKKIVRFVLRPLNSFKDYEIVLVYEQKEQHQELKREEALSIDFGVDNLSACVDTFGNSFLIDGRYLKSIIQGSNKYMAKIELLRDKQYPAYLKKKAKITADRENRIEDYLNKSVHYIISHCLKYKIGNIVYGTGISLHEAPNLGHRNNQIFTQFPYAKLIRKLKFQCKKFGISSEWIDECYTSQASFFDNDPLPEHLSRKQYEFSGRRKHRG